MLPAALLPMLSEDLQQVHPNSIPAPSRPGMIPALLLPMLSDDFPVKYPRTLPEQLVLTVTPLFNRIAIQVTEVETVVAGTTIEGYVDIRKNGVWHNGTELFQRYQSDEYYANCFNLLEDTEYKLRLTVRLRDTTTQAVVKQFVHHFIANTRSSATPQQTAGGEEWYVDPVDGTTAAGGGTGTLANPFKWLNDRTWQAGDTIVIMNGDFSAAANVTQRGVGSASSTFEGAPDNWIRLVPYSLMPVVGGVPHDAEKETIKSRFVLNGPWTLHSSGVWKMTTDKNIGVVRDEDTGWQLYRHEHLSQVSTTEPGIVQGLLKSKFPQLPGTAVQGWHVNTGTDTLYLRTYDGNEPEADRYVAGFAGGLIIRNTRYVSVEGLAIDLCDTAAGEYGLRIGTFGARECDHIYVKDCSFRDCTAGVFSNDTSGPGKCADVLLDDCEWIRNGIKEVFLDRCDYSESDPYDADYGYHPIKATVMARSAVFATGIENLTIRNPTVVGYDLHNENSTVTFAAAPFNGGKNLDMHGGWCKSSVVGVAEFGSAANVWGGYVNGALWNMRIDDGAEPVAMSPNNSGPIWMFACYGDGFLHVPIKIGIQATTSGYTDANGNGFKVLANLSFACAGFPMSESHANMTFQTGHSGVLASNIVIKGYQNKEASPLGDWFVYCRDPIDVAAGRVNQWTRGLLYIVSTAGDPVRPKIRWRDVNHDIALDPEDAPPEDEILFTDFAFDWSARSGSVDPFPSGIAAGMNPAITTKSVYVRGITDLAGDEEGDPVAIEDLPIGCFPLRAAE
jgi:hypothetical protein